MMTNDKFFYIPTFDFTRYDITSSWMQFKTQKITNYLNNQEVIETTNYYYNTDHKHLNPMSVSVQSPDNTISETTYQYAHEKNNQKLITANMIGIPLETKTV
ncbi:hypothetical protein, partial [Chryseobacterium tongliaoense]|uniref:hypothetical protein n=1 Tax=Chryseobacterium tongliaoense TaxID=3240933 RepID=UPI003519C948